MAGHELKRVLGKGFSIAASLGLIIGLGILRTPGEIAVTVQDPLLYLGLWAGGGAMVLLSLSVAAELIAITPRSGGTYALIEHAFGRYPGFLIGWADWVSNGASTALKSVVLMEYIALLYPAAGSYTTEGALMFATLFAGLQLGGVKLSGGIYQGGAAIVALIMLGVTLALVLGGPAAGDTSMVQVQSAELAGLAGFGIIIASITYAYDGWMGVSYFGGEIRGGGRVAAIGSIKAVLIVIALYLGLNAALVYSVPLSSLVGHDLALAGALEILYGNGFASLIVWVAVFILLAHLNIQYMLGARILYALSIDEMGTRRATVVSELGTPTGALFFHWLLVIFLIMAGGWSFLLNMAALLWILVYVAVMIGVFRLRRVEKDTKRPYKAPGFPLTGIICAVLWAATAVFLAVMDVRSALYSAGLVLVSIPAYFWLKSHRQF
jgi:APA family basic amino acid/polyamine antiporter